MQIYNCFISPLLENCTLTLFSKHVHKQFVIDILKLDMWKMWLHGFIFYRASLFSIPPIMLRDIKQTLVTRILTPNKALQNYSLGF